MAQKNRQGLEFFRSGHLDDDLRTAKLADVGSGCNPTFSTQILA